jgi:PI-3-kinase-related kinase SMG-1
VDILVGWHIDTNQDESLITFIADSLVSLHQYWIEDITFSVDLLKQFLEDMDAYTNELAGGSNKAPVLPDEQSTPEECLSKLTALLHVFTTVLKALGVYFSPSRSNVTPADVKNVVSRILHYVMLSINVSFCEDLLIIGNECLCQLSACLQAHFAAFCPDLINYIFCQFDYQDFLSNELALSLVKLLLQMAEDLQSSLPTQFLQRLLSIDSPFMLTRFNNNAEVLKTLLDFFRTLLSVRNIPILETVYKLLLADLEHAMQILDKSFHDPLYGASSDISTFEAQAIAIFDITVLSHVAKASKPIIGMWSPTPTVFYLLTSYLNILTPDMASEYPPVHFALLYSLFQDWLNNGHYISSSTESAFKPVGTSSSSSVSSLSYSGGSLSDIIQILSTQLHKFTLSYDICHLIQRWMADITDCIISNKEIQQDLQSLLDTLCMELLALSFSREHSVRLDNASVLKTLLQHRIVSDKAIKKCVPEIVMRLCDTKGEIRAAYSALLEVVPTHVITSFNNGVEEFHPPNGRKGIEGLRNCKGTHHARHLHLTKPSQVTFHGHHFRAIMGFIMNGLAPRYDDNVMFAIRG